MRADSARRMEFHAASMSCSRQRASEQMVAPRTVSAIAAMAAASPGEAAAKPASMISTLRASSCFATSIFSFRFMLQPGDCSPSRSVVSKILTVLPMVSCPLLFRILPGLQGQKKLRPLIQSLRDEAKAPRYHSCCRNMVRPLYAHLTMRSPVTVGIRSLLPVQRTFSGQLPGEFHCFLTLPYTNRQLSADRGDNYFTRSSPLSICFYIRPLSRCCQDFF